MFSFAILFKIVIYVRLILIFPLKITFLIRITKTEIEGGNLKKINNFSLYVRVIQVITIILRMRVM